jgi:hypothetical protein
MGKKHECIIDLESCNERLAVLEERGPVLAERLKAIKGVTSQINKRLKNSKLAVEVWLEEPFKDDYVLGYRHGNRGYYLFVASGEEGFSDEDIEVRCWHNCSQRPLADLAPHLQVLALRQLPSLLTALVEQLEDIEQTLDNVLPPCTGDEPCPLCGNKG